MMANNGVPPFNQNFAFGPVCYFHRRFGPAANACKSPCSIGLRRPPIIVQPIQQQPPMGIVNHQPVINQPIPPINNAPPNQI